MNIAIIGYGKMGHIIEKLAIDKGINVKAKIDPAVEDATYKDITKEALKDVDVCIEFTTPDAVLDNIGKIAALKKNIIVGTTAWYDKTEEAKTIVKENNIGLIYSPNFSIGVNIFFRLMKEISKMMNSFDEYGVSMTEAHHIHKKDKPSGTAKRIAAIIKENIERIENIDIKSIREGEIPGTHTVEFESNTDIITLEHKAKNREGFALGAIMAAEWIKDKKGFFTIDDMMKEVIGGK